MEPDRVGLNATNCALQMKPLVAHFATKLLGGDGIAAQRLHFALSRTGVESRMYFGEGESLDTTIIPAFQNRSFLWRNVAGLAHRRQRIREAKGCSLFGPRWARRTPIQAFGELPAVINLHRVVNWLDLPSFFGSLPSGLPVVWTLHGLTPITGGCDYAGDCDSFARECGNCPLLKSPHPRDASHRFFLTKAHWFERTNLHFVGNSEWTTTQARRSGLLNHAKSVRTIPLGLNVEQYAPLEKSVAKRALGIPDEKFVVGFACLDFNEKRKGAEILMESLRTFPNKEVVLVVLGAGKWPETGIETICVGSTNSPCFQSVFYSALDVFAMPSRVETFGLVALESMACGTPVTTYPVGAMPEVVVDGKTGLIEREIGSVSGFARMLQWMWRHPTERTAMGYEARRRVVENFTDSLMARRYVELYSELLPVEKSFNSFPPGF